VLSGSELDPCHPQEENVERGALQIYRTLTSAICGRICKPHKWKPCCGITFPFATALYVAPLCPAGHLPRKEGDFALVDGFANGQRRRISAGNAAGAISPLAGEMSGRTEGGVKGTSIAILGQDMLR
jgi:hypothetical protein